MQEQLEIKGAMRAIVAVGETADYSYSSGSEN